MRLTFLGTGTSTGVPQIGCNCRTCVSTDPRDQRLRCSALVSYKGKNLLIDCGPDFRQQILSQGAPTLDALLVTHSHYDHVGGLDDLRPYSAATEGGFPVYCRPDVARAVRRMVPYSFAEIRYPGVPTFNLTEIAADEPFEVSGIAVTPLPILHDSLPIVGFRIGNLAYITDAKTIPPSTAELIRGVDTLVISALRFREHHSHLTLNQALRIINATQPRAAYLTHMSHEIGLAAETAALLPPTVRLAYDGLSISIPD